MKWRIKFNAETLVGILKTSDTRSHTIRRNNVDTFCMKNNSVLRIMFTLRVFRNLGTTCTLRTYRAVTESININFVSPIKPGMTLMYTRILLLLLYMNETLGKLWTRLKYDKCIIDEITRTQSGYTDDISDNTADALGRRPRCTQ